MADKYKLTHRTKEVDGHTLHQIKALKDFGDVKKGNLGGWVESYDNLSQLDIAWVYDDAMVYGDSYVFGDAHVLNHAIVRDKATICNHAHVGGNAQVCGDASICNYAQVFDNAQVYVNALVSGNARVYGNAYVYGSAHVLDNAQVYGHAWVFDHAQVGGNAQVFDHAWVLGTTIVIDNAKVYGDSELQGGIYIRENDEIKDKDSYLIFNNTWSSGRQFVYVLSNHHWHVDLFDGTGEELIKKAYQDSELSGKMYELYVNFAKQVVETRQHNKGLDNVQ